MINNFYSVLQWKPLNIISGYVISRLMWSHFNIPFTKDYFIKITGYRYHSVSVITFGMAQSDHIKRLLLYKIFYLHGTYEMK